MSQTPSVRARRVRLERGARRRPTSPRRSRPDPTPSVRAARTVSSRTERPAWLSRLGTFLALPQTHLRSCGEDLPVAKGCAGAERGLTEASQLRSLLYPARPSFTSTVLDAQRCARSTLLQSHCQADRDVFGFAVQGQGDGRRQPASPRGW